MAEDFVQKIVSRVRERLSHVKKKRSICELEELAKRQLPPLNFKDLFRSGNKVIIAEVKKASPSRGLIRNFDDPTELVQEYVKGGADGVSVLTECDFFKGSIEYIKLIRNLFNIPILCKDFILDVYQIVEARAYGADFYLLIAEILELPLMTELVSYGRALGMEPLIEFHSEEQIEKVMKCAPLLVGINNRDLKTFDVDIKTTERLAGLIPHGVHIITESGIKSDDDILYLSKFVDGFLIGERLLMERFPSSLLRRWKALLRNDIK